MNNSKNKKFNSSSSVNKIKEKSKSKKNHQSVTPTKSKVSFKPKVVFKVNTNNFSDDEVKIQLTKKNKNNQTKSNNNSNNINTIQFTNNTNTINNLSQLNANSPYNFGSDGRSSSNQRQNTKPSATLANTSNQFQVSPNLKNRKEKVQFGNEYEVTKSKKYFYSITLSIYFIS